ncbi:MAG: TPM domain-containing protein [Candidatus Bipolaricaulia bacterium]
MARQAHLALAASFLLLLLLLVGPALAIQQVPQPLDYVSDYAEVIDEATEAYLNGLLRELEEKTTAQIAVLTVKTTKPLDIFTYGMEVFDRWGIGKKGKDNGLLFLAAIGDREMHIFTGYGLEGLLPDGKVGEIRDQEILPRFKVEDYAGGVRRGVEAFARIIAQDAGVELTGLAGGAPPGEEREPSGDLRVALIVIVLLFFLFFWFLSRRRRGLLRPSPFPWIFWSGGLPAGGKGGSSSGSFGGGFSRGGFGGFGGGRSGGGGAGGRW